ncbi:unnamed protein product, partial [Arabidopsis halleri]
MAEEPPTPSLIPNSNPTGCKIRTIFKFERFSSISIQICWVRFFKRFNPDLKG